MRYTIGILVTGMVALSMCGATAIAHATNSTPAMPQVSRTASTAEPIAGRYLRPTFTHVNITRDVTYGHAMNHAGVNEPLHLDVYEPAPDVDRQRATVLWLHPGGFTTGDKSVGAEYARDFARRGYVSVAIDYRLRPKMQWFDTVQRPFAALDAYDDATMAIKWMVRHATEYAIDPTRIFVAGYSAGAITALEIASPPDGSRSLVIGAMSIAGYGISAARTGEPPRLVFHGTHDWLVPFALAASSCAQTRAFGDGCELVTITDGLHDIGFTKVGPIVEQTGRFFSAIISRTDSNTSRR